MKHYLISLALLFAFSVTQAQIYVKQDAQGAADGSSWENAYTDLQAALDAANLGDNIWMSAGTYIVPLAATEPSNYGRYEIKNPVNIYGGFSGNEAQLDERMPDANPSILSGDIDGDDIENDLISNKIDNALRIMYVDSLLPQATIFDGLIFEGSYGLNDSDAAYELRAGGGIFARSPIEVNNCTFRNNFSRSGVSINLFRGATAGSRISNSNFHNNEAPSPDGQSAGILTVATSDIIIQNCVFSDNVATRGACYTLYSDGIIFEDCTFENNTNTEGFGGALFNWNSRNLLYKNCNFLNNSAANGGVLYNDGREFETHNITFDACTFEGNQAVGWGGGALYNWQAQTIIQDCDIKNNFAANTAGAIYTAGAIAHTAVQNTTFEENRASGGWGGCAAVYTDSRASFQDCDFINNGASTSGGALTIGFRGAVEISNCYLEKNLAQFGGAIYAQNDTTSVRIDSTTFVANNGTSYGGALLVSGGITTAVSHSLFQENTSDFGGAIATFIDTIILPELQLNHNTFSFNQAETQGGALNLFNANTTINNCLFAVNIATDANGGAISHNSFDGYYGTLDIYNSTLAANVAVAGGGISVFAAEGDSTLVNIQNTILANNVGENYFNESPDELVIVNSLGGNLSADLSLEGILLHESDKHAVDPLFVDDFDDFHLLADSPAIDAGVESTMASSYDLDGNPRVGQIDIGAYEFQMVSGLRTTQQDDLSLQLSPNPVSDKVILNMNNHLKGKLNLRILSLDGKALFTSSFAKHDNAFQLELNVSGLAKGVYQVVVTDGKQMGSVALLKL